MGIDIFFSFPISNVYPELSPAAPQGEGRRLLPGAVRVLHDPVVEPAVVEGGGGAGGGGAVGGVHWIVEVVPGVCGTTMVGFQAIFF